MKKLVLSALMAAGLIIGGSNHASAVNQATLDMIGSTPYGTNDFFHIKFLQSDPGITLKKVTLDLVPVNAFFDVTNAYPGYSGSSLSFSGLNGVNLTDITVEGLVDGGQTMSLVFADGVYNVGDTVNFGLDIDLFSNIDGFGATPSELIGMGVSFMFSNNSNSDVTVDDDLISDSTDDQAPVPEPSSMILGAISLAAMGLRNRKAEA
jgi:hypothetical protein